MSVSPEQVVVSSNYKNNSEPLTLTNKDKAQARPCQYLVFLMKILVSVTYKAFLQAEQHSNVRHSGYN